MENKSRTPLLDNITKPDDIKNLSDDELNALCGEIRELMIETVSRNGGHLASNLGTVELTVALHKSLNLPDDKIVWDVGHQAYTHKLLTGRADRFNTLRTEGGISGFVRPDESKYDSFYEGHAGTSVSQAAGLAASNKLKGNKNYAVAVIGDGSFGNGMVYEALNHFTGVQGRLIVILNDNEMSISENVSALARRLAVMRAKPEYYRLKANTEKLLNRIPLIGKYLSNFFFRVKSLAKNIVYNNSAFFENFGFRYIGPIDGHDIPTLCEALNTAKMIDAPVLMHVNTVKGRGYEFAENSPEKYHGISKFDVITGEDNSSDDTYSSVFGNALCDFASKDKRICAVTAAMSLGTGLEPFFAQFPSRAYDVGIAEEHAVTFCSGLSAGGMIPVFAVYSTFLQRCADQLIHDGALQRNKIVIAVDRAGLTGEDGETHQGLFDVALTESIPGTVIYTPATYREINKALYNSFYKDEGLVIVRYPKGSMPAGYDEVFTGEDYEIIGDSGCGNLIVTYGRTVFSALEARNILLEKGIETAVVKIFRIRPVPEELVEFLSGAGHIAFFEEGMVSGGIGEHLGALVLENGYHGTYRVTGIGDEFVQHASVSSQIEKYNLDGNSIAQITEKEVTQ